MKKETVTGKERERLCGGNLYERGLSFDQQLISEVKYLGKGRVKKNPGGGKGKNKCLNRSP